MRCCHNRSGSRISAFARSGMMARGGDLSGPNARRATLPRMDPLYRPFFSHVWAICWPILWWNLVRLTAWRKRTGRPVWVTVDKFGNVHVRIIGDAPKRRALPVWAPRWESSALAGGLPQGVRASLALSGHDRTRPGTIRTLSGHAPDPAPARSRAPP